MGSSMGQKGWECRVMGAAVPGCHCARAWMMSFTSMVPMTIFSLLMVSWAVEPSRCSRVMSTRLPLVTVLAANLLGGEHRASRPAAPCHPLVPWDAPVGTGRCLPPTATVTFALCRLHVLKEALSVPTVIWVGTLREVTVPA